MPLLALSGISKRFGNHQALNDVSLTIEPGEVVAIIGRSGSGKSTLLRCINGLERPDRGTIEFDGEAFGSTPRQLRALRRNMGIVFQSYNLFPHLSVERNITLGLTAAKGMATDAARVMAAKVLRMVDLEDKIDAYPMQLSGGDGAEAGTVRRSHCRARSRADR
jgi:polar amino acid transport system ATP-binding protein